ncbi:MAG: hypothetical protein ACFCU8_18040 [Thermosynechococcaceae cyanobacterium]
MPKHQNLGNRPLPYKTYQLIRECLKETHVLDKDKTSEKLSKEKGVIAFLRKSLFEKSLQTYFTIIAAFFLVIIIGGGIVSAITDSIYVRLIYILAITILYLSLIFFLQKITPRQVMGYDERWSNVTRSFCYKTNIDSKYGSNTQKLNEVRRRIQRAINYYGREGEPLRFIINLMWGGIVIGCLPDPIFQKALVTLSPIEIWSTNQFGAFSLLIVPFIAGFHYSRYGLPMIWMEQVVSQIELELE